MYKHTNKEEGNSQSKSDSINLNQSPVTKKETNNKDVTASDEKLVSSDVKKEDIVKDSEKRAKHSKASKPKEVTRTISQPFVSNKLITDEQKIKQQSAQADESTDAMKNLQQQHVSKSEDLRVDQKAIKEIHDTPPPPPQKEKGSTLQESSLQDIADHKAAGKFIIETQELLSQKRHLRKVNRQSKYDPVTLTRMDMFEKDYEKYDASPPEYFPLHLVRNVIINQNLSADLVALNFNGIDQLTDYLFPLLLGGGTAPHNTFVNLKKLNLVGCYHITDQGLKWIAKLFPDVQMIEINACRKVTEKGLHELFIGCKNLQNLAAMANDVSTIPDSITQTRLLQGSFQYAGNPIIYEGKAYSLNTGKPTDSFQDPLKKKLVILRHDSIKESVMSFIDINVNKKARPFIYTEQFKIFGEDHNEPQNSFNIFEIAAKDSLIDSIISEGSIVAIVYSPPNDTKKLNNFANQIADIISSVIIKCSDIVILLVAIVTDTSKEDGLKNLIKARLDYLKEGLYRATYRLYQRNWHFENLDFKGQQSLSWGIASLEALENLLLEEGNNTRFKTILMTNSSFQQDLLKALSECAVAIKTLVPWVHCDWSAQINETIKKIPKLGATTQPSIFQQTDEEARAYLHKRYSYPRLGKVLNLLNNWGEGVFISHPHNSLCVTDLKAYENIVHQIIENKPSETVKMKSLRKEIPCWTKETFEAEIQEMKSDIKPSHAASLLKHQGLLLEVKSMLLENKSKGKPVYIRMSDIPKDHSLVEHLWPEPCPVSRVFQTNRCYNFLPTIPPRFMPKLHSTILKTYQPLCIWKSGFLLRQGPVDIKASLHRYKGGELDKTPVLIVSARVVDLHKGTSNIPEDTSPSSQYASQVAFASLRQVLLLVDSVFQKLKVYGCITLPCPECAGHSIEGMISISKNWHLPYYIAISNKHKHCKHHRHINPVYLCDALEEQGEDRIVPLHNYPYHIDSVKVNEERIKSKRHRPMDPPEKCFYCGSLIDIPCLHCHMCSQCTKQFTKLVKTVQPGFITSKSFKLQMFKDGEMQDDERIVSNTKGSVYFYKKGHRMQLLPAMTPFYWDEIFITILKGANFFLHLTFGTGQKLEYHGLAGVLVDQNGVTRQNEMWKSRDANLINIKLDSVELGKRVKVSIYLKGLKVLSEEINAWNMKLDINSEKAGIYIIHTPGIKTGWQSDETRFMKGSTLEVAEDGKTIHQAVILEKSTEGYLTLEMNNKQTQYIYSSPQLMPLGTAAALQASLSSTLPTALTQEGSDEYRRPVPLWSFLKYQVPCGFESLLKNAPNHELSYPCLKMDFPSVLYSKQVHMRDRLEKIMFTDGEWNFPMTALLLLPASFTNEDLLVCSQQRFLYDFKLHPLCCFRADVNTVISVGPTTPQLESLECFHVVHLVDNAGFEPKSIKKDEGSDSNTISTWFDVFLKDHMSSFGILWAWMVLLLRLQHDTVTQFKALSSSLNNAENISASQVNESLKQIVHLLSQVVFLSLGKEFKYKQSLSDMAVEHLKALTLVHGETQGLVKMTPPFTEEFLLMCESHQASWLVNKNLNQFSALPGSYSQFIYSLNLSGNNLTELPPGMFASLRNLKDLCLTDNKLELLPPEIAHCKQLINLSVSENYLKSLPSTLQICHELSRLDISKNFFSEFPDVVLKLKSLVRIYASNLLLKSLPENIGDLSSLKILSLNGNCFTTLPASLGKLQDLTDLCLNGVCWIKSRNNGLLSKENFEDFLATNNLHHWLDRHIQDKTNIFQLFDEDTNGTLDSKEIGKLNATIFYIFPRFGYKGKEAPDEDTPCGFPEVIFELKNLQYLSLQYQGIISVPENIQKLAKLAILHLGNNPNMLTISAQLGSLPLKRLELDACSRLKTPPKEIRAKGFVTTFAYLKRLLTGSVSCKRTKLMLVGLGGAGKTSLVKAFLSDSKQTPPSIEQEITDGIDICHWAVPTKEGPIIYNVWDFAGQTVYYNTHQFFLSDRAIYLLLWNIRLGYEHAGLKFWLNSIAVHAPKAPIFVVGTHVDQMSKIELPKKELQQRYNQICGFHFVSSHTGQGIKELQDKMIEITLQQQYMGEKIPGVWLSFEESIKSITDKSVIEYRELENKASRSGIFEHTEVAHAVQFLHELGSLQHFTNASLKSHVVINPQWLVDVMACIVSVKDSHIKDGKLHHSDIATVWKDYEPSLHKWLLMLTEEFDLTFPIKDSPIHLVPCLLPETRPEFDWPEIHKDDLNKETKLVYTFDYLPAGLFNRAQVRLHQFCDSSLIWKKGSYLKKNGHICLIHQSKDSEVTVKAYGPRPENIVLLVHEVFEILILESFQGITYDFYLPCPDCLRVGTKDPHLFPASLIRRATELKSPFLQCLKYFHTISITDLHGIMPPDSSKDFDLHLVQAIRGMKELKQDLVADVFMSYCEQDLQKPIEVSPNRVIEDVEKLGYKCWNPKDKTETMAEMAKALMDAKIFMVFISNSFVANETCCNLFRFAIQTLKKPIILVVVGETLDWQRSSLGILTADMVYVNMTQSNRYESKLAELTESLRKKHSISVEKNKSYPPCFISYTWKNSAKAVAKGSKTTEGALGFGDPRDIKGYLEEKGISCWLDEERVGQHGLFEDIAEGLLHCQVVVVCISDQYVESNNCNREFRYAVNILQVPVVLAVVGTGDKWRATELGIMSLKLPLVSFQEKSEFAMEKLLKLVQEQLSNSCRKSMKGIQNRMEEQKKLIQEQQRLSFQELCELAQRKFVRQISEYTEQLDSGPYPSIILIDFSSDVKGVDETRTKENASNLHHLSAPDFYDQKFCAQLLCEHEEGWHLSGSAIPLEAGFGRTIDQYLPYIARMTVIAKYSKKIALNCLTTRIGQMYLKWLEESPSVNADIQASYVSLRQVIYNTDPKYQKANLERCLLPSGKYTWLCETHRRAMKVTVLPRESARNLIHHQTEILGIDHMLQALHEVEPTGLSQQLKRKAEALKNRDENKEISEENKASAEKSSSSNTPVQGRHPVSVVADKGSTKPTGQQQSGNQETVPRPTSRACFLM